jgi:hypothetical protein
MQTKRSICQDRLGTDASNKTQNTKSWTTCVDTLPLRMYAGTISVEELLEWWGKKRM